jgi:FkbM family methyltransferase
MKLVALARAAMRKFIDRPGPVTDFASIPLPAGASIKMSRNGGRDQVLEQALREGWEAFETPLPRIFLETIARTTGLVVDVGANTGFYSLLAARRGSNVLAFEPVPAVREILIRNVAGNRLQGKIKISACAASDRAGRATLFVPDPSHGLIETSSSLNEQFQPHASTLEVDVAPLDTLLLPGQKVGVVKIDAEGHEAAVLRGAMGLIARDRPVLFVEVLPAAEMIFMTRLLAEMEYVDIPLPSDGQLSIQPEVHFVANGWNHAFVPREAASALLG